jgi:hypothetical protein
MSHLYASICRFLLRLLGREEFVMPNPTIPEADAVDTGVDPKAIATTPPPPAKPVPTRKLTLEELKAKGMDPTERVKRIRGYAKGGKVSSASKRADGCAVKGKTRGKMI